MEHPHTFVRTYAPIRAQIQASLETDNQEMVTDICLAVAAIAHGQQQHYLQKLMTYGMSERDALEELRDVQRCWPEAIAAVRYLSEHIATRCRAAGLPSSRVDACVNEKLQREFFRLALPQDH